MKWRDIIDSLKRECEGNHGRKDVLTIVQGIESFYNIQVPEGDILDIERKTASDQIDAILAQTENVVYTSVYTTREWKAWRSDCQKIKENYEVLRKIIINNTSKICLEQ